MYLPGVHPEVFSMASRISPLPLSYNGDVFTAEDCAATQARFPIAAAIMLGRGLAADPGVVAKARGGSADKELLYRFYTSLCYEYPLVFGNQNSAAHRIKAIWQYLLCSFRGGESFRKKIIKAKEWQDLMSVGDSIFQTLELLPAAEGIR